MSYQSIQNEINGLKETNPENIEAYNLLQDQLFKATNAELTRSELASFMENDNAQDFIQRDHNYSHFVGQVYDLQVKIVAEFGS